MRRVLPTWTGHTAAKRFGAALVVMLFVLVHASPASAHAVLVETTPVDGAQLDTAPSVVTLAFDEPVGVGAGAIRVYDSSGDQVDRGDAATGEQPEEAMVSLPELPAGAYVVTWRVVSTDGHPIKGAFLFRVGATGDVVDESLVASLLGEDADVPFAVMSWLVRWVTYTSVLLVAGAALFQLVIAGRRVEPVTRLIRLAIVVGAVGSVLQIPLFAAEATGLGWPALSSTSALAQAATSSVGWASLVRVLAFATLWIAVRRPGVVWVVAGVVGLVAAELITGHTRTMEPWLLVMGADAIHVVAAAAWFGGLVALAMSLRVARAEGDLAGGARLVGAFSNLAGFTVLALAVAGVALAWVEVRTWHALSSTAFGWTLLVKMGVVAGVLAVAVYNNRVLVPSVIASESDRNWSTFEAATTGAGVAVASKPRLDAETAWRRLNRSIRFELVGLLVVIAVTSLLINLQPAAEAAGVSGPYSTYVPFGEGQLNLVVDPNRVGMNEIHVYVLTAGGLPALISGEASIELAMPDEDIGPIIRRLQVAGPGHYIHVGPELAIPGEWEITVRQRVSEFEENTAHAAVTVNSQQKEIR
jgi:copper transport protein